MDQPIGVFDSGVGGLTVLKELERTLSGERFLYLGDTARVPYGTKSMETITRYSIEIANYLIVRHDIKMLVVACNTASSPESTRIVPSPRNSRMGFFRTG